MLFPTNITGNYQPSKIICFPSMPLATVYKPAGQS